MTDTTRLAEAIADRYTVERELGAGGMATVYLAHDIRHDRKVALKVLRPELAAILGGERFLKEIRTTANLQHPHILTLHDSGEAGGLIYYVMPYVEGESLRDRLNRERQLPVEDAVRIAKEVAGALDYAHRHGVVHRDIKPENILLHDGSATVADFGIALAASRSEGSTRMTETGMSLGTPQYMAPEQAMGERDITPKVDVYALGCVLYEMLAGEPPYTGPTAQAIIARVMTEQPRSLTMHRHTIPANVEAAVLKSLEKLPADRFASAAEFLAALDSLEFRTTMSAAVASPRARRRLGLVAVVATSAAVVLAAVLAWTWLWPAPRPVARFTLSQSPGQELLDASFGTRIAISPDGRRLVYVGAGTQNGQLMVRELGQLNATAIPGTEGARSPFFSPDGAAVGFFAGSVGTTLPTSLKVVSLAGASPLTLTDTNVTGAGGSWGPDGYIYFDTNAGIQRIRSTGSGREQAVPLDSAAGHAWPEVLPKGRGIIYRLRRGAQTPQTYDIYVEDLRSHQQRALVHGVFARFMEPGYLVYVTAEGKLLAAPFDQKTLTLTGTPTGLIDGVSVRTPVGIADVAISRNGTLVYTMGPAVAAAVGMEAVWVTREGIATRIDRDWTFQLGANPGFRLSPDGKRLAIGIRASGHEDIWIKQLDDGPFTRLTFEGLNSRPEWTADGHTVMYASSRAPAGNEDLHQRRADGTGAEEILLDAARPIYAMERTPSAALILRLGVPPSRDIYLMRAKGDTALLPLLAAPGYDEVAPALSPDGRWLAYASNESGRSEIYVRPFPRVEDGRWQVSRNGGTEPRWAHSGRELFYRQADDAFVAAAVSPGPAFRTGEQRTLFSAARLLAQPGHTGYDVSRDDRRFLFLRRLVMGTDSTATTNVVLVQNWLTEVRAAIGKP